MKKLVAILSVALFALGFAGCKKKAEETTPDKTPTTDNKGTTDATKTEVKPAVTKDATPAPAAVTKDATAAK